MPPSSTAPELQESVKWGNGCWLLGKAPIAYVYEETSTREIAHRERHQGDSATTIVRPAAAFLARAQAGKIKELGELFH